MGWAGWLDGMLWIGEMDAMAWDGCSWMDITNCINKPGWTGRMAGWAGCNGMDRIRVNLSIDFASST